MVQRVFLQLQVLINFSNIMPHVRDFTCRFHLELLKRFLLILQYTNLKQVIIFKVMQVVDNFFGSFKGNHVIIIWVICVQVDIWGPFVLLIFDWLEVLLTGISCQVIGGLVLFRLFFSNGFLTNWCHESTIFGFGRTCISWGTKELILMLALGLWFLKPSSYG